MSKDERDATTLAVRTRSRKSRIYVCKAHNDRATGGHSGPKRAKNEVSREEIDGQV